jgi:GDP-L-fucose synthase
MPTNLYGPGDNYHAQNSHVLPALIRRFHEAKKTGQSEVCIWGTGKPRRELLHADDLAGALLFLLSVNNPPDWINVGTGKDQTILELANLVKNTTEFDGEITHDLTREDGTPVKRLDVSLLDNLGWKARIPLEAGIKSTYGDFLRCEENNSLRI